MWDFIRKPAWPRPVADWDCLQPAPCVPSSNPTKAPSRRGARSAYTDSKEAEFAQLLTAENKEGLFISGSGFSWGWFHFPIFTLARKLGGRNGGLGDQEPNTAHVCVRFRYTNAAPATTWVTRYLLVPGDGAVPCARELGHPVTRRLAPAHSFWWNESSFHCRPTSRSKRRAHPQQADRSFHTLALLLPITAHTLPSVSLPSMNKAEEMMPLGAGLGWPSRRFPAEMRVLTDNGTCITSALVRLRTVRVKCIFWPSQGLD